MRELKFRAWDKRFSKYRDVEAVFPDGSILAIMPPCNDREQIKAEDVIIEQYTGLKDKNGKEIYEGDIVEEFINCGVRRCRTVWQVRWYEEECCFELHYLKGKRFGDSMMGRGVEYKVIGNIHENKELLEEKS